MKTNYQKALISNVCAQPFSTNIIVKNFSKKIGLPAILLFATNAKAFAADIVKTVLSFDPKKYFNIISVLIVFLFGIHQTKAQCISPILFPISTIQINGTPGSTTQIATNNFAGEYSNNNYSTAGDYTAVSSIATDYLTVTTNANAVIASGTTPLYFTIPSTGIYRLHVATSSSCGTQNSIRKTSILKENSPCISSTIGTTFANSTDPCSGSTISLGTNFFSLNSNITYQWESSTVGTSGPFTQIALATASTYSTNAPTIPTWYRLVSTCPLSSTSNISIPVLVNSPQTTIINAVPYFEGFETPNITASNLPNCSWLKTGDWRTATAIQSFNRSPKTGNGYAHVSWSTIAGGDILYTNGIQLNAGIVYTASAAYKTDGASGFFDFSMLLTTAQNNASIADTVAIVTNPINTNYINLTDTFSVSTSGVYYLAFRANANTNPWYISMDDISITGCPNIPKTSTTYTSSCNAITWNTQNISASGTYTFLAKTPLGCDSIATLQFVLNSPITTSIMDTGAFTYELPWSVTVTTNGTYTHMYASINGCDSLVSISVVISGVNLKAKAFLGGAMDGNSGLMKDSLRRLNIIPLQTPYGSGDYTIGYGAAGTEMMNSNVLTVSNNNAIVDWVYVSLRSKMDSTIVVDNRSGLLQRDGDIVDIDGSSPLQFSYPIPDHYFVSIKHRNHLGMMSLQSIPLSAAPNSTFDFSNPNTALFMRAAPLNNAAPLTGAGKTISSIRTMYPGNCNISTAPWSKLIAYNNLLISDRTSLFGFTGSTNTMYGYSIFDLDLNGSARFNGLNPDRLLILNTCVLSNTVTVQEQIPN
jgi:hypothetical protein